MYTVRTPARRRTAALALVMASGLALAGCSGGSSASPRADGTDGPAGASTGASDGGTNTKAPDGPALTVNVNKGASDVPVDTLVNVSADGGSLQNVRLRSDAGTIEGTMSEDGRTWTAGDLLEPGSAYTLVAKADDDGATSRKKANFTTQALTLDQQTYPSVSPLPGETVGVGMPVVVNFDIAVTDKAAFEKHMTVNTTPSQAGSWNWISDNVAHWRPKSYWEAGTKVDVDVDVNGVDAGNGIYGQEDRNIDFQIGDAHIYKVDAASHEMRVFSNGELLRTVPITTGKAGFTTRSGTKVISEKFASKRMNSETVGISGSEAYDIDNVQYAMRVTNSGEFLHAAPWSVGSQGNANVSHGCTGMSTEDAGWLFKMTLRGDVVETVGTDRPMELTNGYGDWNESFKDYKQGSAL